MERDLGCIGNRELSLGVFREQEIDELLTGFLMWGASYQHGGIRHDKAAYLVFTLVWVHHRHWLTLAHSIYDIIAVNKAEGELATRDEIGTIAIARRQPDGVFMQILHERLRTLIA